MGVGGIQIRSDLITNVGKLQFIDDLGKDQVLSRITTLSNSLGLSHGCGQSHNVRCTNMILEVCSL